MRTVHLYIKLKYLEVYKKELMIAKSYCLDDENYLFKRMVTSKLFNVILII